MLVDLAASTVFFHPLLRLAEADASGARAVVDAQLVGSTRTQLRSSYPYAHLAVRRKAAATTKEVSERFFLFATRTEFHTRKTTTERKTGPISKDRPR